MNKLYSDACGLTKKNALDSEGNFVEKRVKVAEHINDRTALISEDLGDPKKILEAKKIISGMELKLDAVKFDIQLAKYLTRVANMVYQLKAPSIALTALEHIAPLYGIKKRAVRYFNAWGLEFDDECSWCHIINPKAHRRLQEQMKGANPMHFRHDIRKKKEEKPLEDFAKPIADKVNDTVKQSRKELEKSRKKGDETKVKHYNKKVWLENSIAMLIPELRELAFYGVMPEKIIDAIKNDEVIKGILKAQKERVGEPKSRVVKPAK